MLKTDPFAFLTALENEAAPPTLLGIFRAQLRPLRQTTSDLQTAVFALGQTVEGLSGEVTTEMATKILQAATLLDDVDLLAGTWDRKLSMSEAARITALEDRMRALERKLAQSA